MMLQICFHNLAHSEAVEIKVRQRAQKLERICEDITSCRVAIEAPRYRASGNAFAVHIEVAVPGEKLVATRQPADERRPEDVYVAIREAFDTMRRQLKAYVERHRGDLRASPQGASY